MSHIMSAQDLEKWDKLLSWDKVQQEIGDRLRNSDKYDDSTTLYYGPQLCHTLRNPASIKCMTHFPSKVGDVFVSYYRMGIQDQFSIWTLKSTDSGVTIENQRFDINGDVKAFLFVPKHRAYLCFCSDLVMRVFTDAHSKCVETNDQQCLTTIRCMAYNRETDEIYVGGIGVLQKWKINGAEHSAVAEPGEVFNIDIQEDEWVIDIKVDPRNKQLMAVTYEGIFVVNYETMKQTHHLQNRHENSLRCCCFYKDREYFITGGGDGAVKVWNAVVFTQVHVFHGHRSAITGLQTHKIDPLLFSSSLDGSVQIWRMDNFSKFMRLDLAEKIYSMKLLNEEEFYCQTETQIKVYSLNQFYNLFAPVESSVYKLQLCQGSQGQPSRIIASTEDGSVRLFSPVTGASLTIIYPMPTFQVLSCFAYSREKNQLHSVLQHGEILIFNCSTNPCRAVERWIPQNNDEEVSQIVQLTLEYQKDEAMITDTIILGGLANGQISLLDASKCVMVKNLQAHIGDITCMETGTDIGETGFKLMETSRKLATGGADGVIRVWELSVNEGILYDNIVFQMMVKIPCVGMPKHISMYENTLSVSTSDKADRGKLHMYRMDGVDKEIQITTLQHPNDEDHTGMITAIDKCPLLGLFATASEDGFIKIWNRHNQLIREMSFGEPMHGLCFANVRGDILFGFQNHICTIPLTSYFPRNYLERITRQEFKDETRELPLAYNHKIKPWFDPNKVPKFSVSLDRRTEEKKAAEDVKVLDNRGSFPREVTLIEDFDDEEHLQNIEDHILLSDRIASPAIARKTVVKFASDNKSRPSTAGEGDIEEEAKAYQFRRRFSAPDPPVKKMKIEKAKEERRRSFSLYMDKLSPWERDLYNKQPIIAPDGYIPNSVVRKRIGYSSPKVRRRKDTWTIDSVKVPPPAKMVYKPQAPEEEDHWEEDIRPFSWGDSQEGRRSTDYTPWRKMQTFMRATSTLSNRSTGSSKMKGSRRSTPTTPGKYELKSKRFDFHKVDLDLGTPDRMRRSLGTKSRERTKSFRLTNMVVDEQSTSVTFKDGSRSGLGHRKGMLPAVDMDIIRRLLAEEFFPDLQGNESFDLIMQNLIRLLDTEDAELHSQICAYIIAIHNEIGIPDHYLDRIVSKLSVQLKWESVPIRRNALRVLKAIGADRQDVLALLLPMLVSSEEDLRDEAKETLAYLAGIENKDELHELMESLGMIQPHFDSKEDEEEALKALAMRLDVPYRSESFTDWINNWVDDTSSIYDSDSEIGLNDIGKAWDGRQHKYKQESLYMTEAASRASTRLRELTFLSKGSRTPIQELDETIAVPGMEGDGVEPQESVQKTGFEAKTDWYNGRAEGYKSGVDKFHEKEKSCGKNPDGSKEMADLSNGKGVGKGAKVFVDGHSRSSDGGSVRSDLVEKGSEICDEKGKGLTDMYKKRHKESVLFEEISDGYQQWEKVSRSEDNRYKKGWGHDLERSEGQQKIGGGYHDATERRRSYGDKGRAEGYDKRSRENIEEGKNKNRSVGHEEKKGEFKNKKSKGEHRLADVKDRSKGCRFPPIKDNRKGNRTKTDGQLTDRSCKSGGSGGFNFRFDPRDPNLYKYYKNRHRRENYRALNRLYSKQLQGDGEDVDSQIGSMDSLSQVGDVMSTIDSGIMSMQDSGIGRDMSDTQSYRSHRISPFISKEKIQLKPVSSIKGRKDSKRSNSHRRYNLSPVKSSSTIGGVSDRTTPSREKEPDWMKFFQTPTALERKRMEMVKKDFQEGNMKPGTAATINYISDKLPSLPGEAGLRLLKSVKVGKNKDSLSPEEKHHKIESIPGKLSVHTRDEDKGQAKFGILEMQWTTSIPVPLQRTPYTDRYSPLSDVTSTLGGSTVIDYPSKKRLPRIVEKYGRSTRSDTEQFPDIPGAIPTPDFQWDYPIPPPPPKESRISIPYIKKEHDNYCKYYTLVKKKMQNYTSVKNDDHSKDQPLPQIEVKKALPERLKLPKEITQLSRTSSMIVPPITLNQLMSARV